jgi:1-acyl-sn-glycerol-3-phosphate acyltransferase
MVDFEFHWNRNEMNITLEEFGRVIRSTIHYPIRKWLQEAFFKKLITQFFQPIDYPGYDDQGRPENPEAEDEEEMDFYEDEEDEDESDESGEEDEGIGTGNEETEEDEPRA